MAVSKTMDELQIGEFATWTKTISETDVYLFAGITGDFNPMHVNEAFAKKTPFGKRIAHGALPLGLIAPVLGTMLPGLGTVVTRISMKFQLPTFFGDTITAKAIVAEKITEKDRVVMKLVWTNQNGMQIGEGEATVQPPSPAIKAMLGAAV